ncbi:MAG: MFS transporter [archaeon]
MKNALLGKKRGTPIKKLGFLMFIVYIAYALIANVYALYLKDIVTNEAYVGIIMAFLTLVSFLSYFLIIPIVEKNDKLKLVTKALLFSAIGYFLYFFIDNIIIFIIVASIITILITIRISSMGLLVRENSSRKKLSKDEGVIYALLNFSYVLGSIIVIFILFYFNYKIIFIISPIFLLISYFLFKKVKLKHGKIKKRLDKKFFKNFLEFFKDKDRFVAYIYGGGVNFWWSLIIVFVPLLIIKSLGEYWIGIFLALSMLPLVIFEYVFGKIANKKGYKKLFFIGFVIPSITALLAFFLFNNIYLVMSLMILASIGMSMVESNTESYFFDVLRGKEDQRFYSPYNTAIDFGHFIGYLIPSVVLLFLPFKFIFLVFCIGTLFLALLSSKLKNIVEFKRKSF